MLHKLSSRSCAQFICTGVPTTKAHWCKYLVIHSLHLFYLLHLLVIFAITQNYSIMPKVYVSVHTSTLIKLSHIWSHPDRYPDQWVIWVSDADLISTHIHTVHCSYVLSYGCTFWYQFLLLLMCIYIHLLLVWHYFTSLILL